MLNELGTALLPSLRRARGSVTLRHQTGPREHAAVAARAGGLEGVEVVPYIEDMAAELAATDLAICRAGAMTVAELAASATPSVLVPFARATGGHQALNARAHAAAGAAWVVEEHELSAERIWSLVEGAAADPTILPPMAAAARGRAVPGAAARIADRLEEMLR